MAKDPKLLESQKNVTGQPGAKHFQTGVMELIENHWKEMVQNLETCYEEWLSQSGEEFPSSNDWAEFKLRSFIETMRKEHGLDNERIIALLRSLPPIREAAPKSETELTPEEKMLHALLGRAGEEKGQSQEETDSEEQSVRIKPLPYFRAMLSIAWNSFRHPLSTTVIDLESGEAVSGETTEIQHTATPSS